MPPLEVVSRCQRAVLWVRVGTTRDGEPLILAPVELSVRWAQKRGEVTNAQGQTVPLDAVAHVDRQIPTGSILWLGTLDSWQGTGSAGADSELHEVVAYAESPDLKGYVNSRAVGLKRFRGDLPEVVDG